MGSRCWECAEIEGYCTCTDRAIYNQESMNKALLALREQIAREIMEDKEKCLEARVKVEYINNGRWSREPVDTEKERALVKMAYDRSAAIAKGSEG